MEILVTALLNIVLLLAALLSAQLAVAWGELGSYPLQGDKSGMAGFGAVILLMPMRWLFLAAALAASFLRGAFSEIPGSQGLKFGVIIAVHLILGVVAYQVFEWICQSVRNGQAAPQRLAVVFGLFLPTAIWLIAFVAVNRAWITRHWLIAGLLAGLTIWAQVAAWRQGYVRPVAAHIPTPSPNTGPEK